MREKIRFGHGIEQARVRRAAVVVASQAASSAGKSSASIDTRKPAAFAGQSQGKADFVVAGVERDGLFGQDAAPGAHGELPLIRRGG